MIKRKKFVIFAVLMVSFCSGWWLYQEKFTPPNATIWQKSPVENITAYEIKTGAVNFVALYGPHMHVITILENINQDKVERFVWSPNGQYFAAEMVGTGGLRSIHIFDPRSKKWYFVSLSEMLGQSVSTYNPVWSYDEEALLFKARYPNKEKAKNMIFKVPTEIIYVSYR